MDDTSKCPMCGELSEGSYLLGSRLHLNCRTCGWWWSALVPPSDEELAELIQGPAQPRDYLLPPT
jgi:hypothetical protein